VSRTRKKTSRVDVIGVKSKSRGKTNGERLRGDTAQPNEQNLKERLIY
jgi:hypothetical protein